MAHSGSMHALARLIFAGALASAASCSVPQLPPEPPPLVSPAPVSQSTLYADLTLEIAARDTVRRTTLTRLQVEVDGIRAVEQESGRFHVQVQPSNVHTVRVSCAGHMAQQWSGSVPDTIRLDAKLCPHGIRVVGFGDSVTAGLKVDTGSRFVMKLVGLIQGARPGFWVDFLDRGHPGDTYASALPRLIPDVLQANPDVTLVEFGTNDAFRVPFAQFPASIDALLSPLMSTCPLVIVTDIPYKPRWYGTWNRDAAPYNQELAAGASRHGALLLALSERFRQEGLKNQDLFYHEQAYNEALPDSQWQGDLHPNAAGNDLIAKAIASLILDATAPRLTPRI